MKQFVSLILAAVFPLALFSWFVPTPYNQIDFVLLWLVAMCLLALPTVYAEVGMAHRSGTSPMSGMQTLTREADASTLWRALVWGSLCGILLVALSLIHMSAHLIYPVLNENLGIHIESFVLPFVLVIAATIASVWGIKTTLIGLIFIALSLVLKISPESCLSFIMTDVSLQEWGRAVALALVSVGAGSCIYWYTHTLDNIPHSADNDTTVSKANKPVASRTVLPIWGVQLVMGLVAFALLATQGTASVLANIIGAFGLLCFATALLHIIAQLLREKFATGNIGMAKSLGLTLLLALIVTIPFTFLSSAIMQGVLVVITLVSVLTLSIFTGWQMKISHLRKSMNFNSELLYNLWRVAIRLVVPLSIVAGLMGWLQIWTGAI